MELFGSLAKRAKDAVGNVFSLWIQKSVRSIDFGCCVVCLSQLSQVRSGPKN